MDRSDKEELRGFSLQLTHTFHQVNQAKKPSDMAKSWDQTSFSSFLTIYYQAGVFTFGKTRKLC